MDYNGTDGDDVIDGPALKLADWTTIYGKRGNDRITFGNGNTIGGQGNDTLIGTAPFATAAYWDSPAAIYVNLQAGTAQDGFGTTDTLVNIHAVQATGFNDTLIGSSGDDQFYGAGGNDTITGGGGSDTVNYYFVKSTAATITYEPLSDTFTVRKNFANDKGTDTLVGISYISFSGTGADGKIISKASFMPQGGFMRAGDSAAPAYPNGAWPTQFKTGDFNGDGKADVLIVTQTGAGTTPSPSYILLGDGAGHFSDASASVYTQQPYSIIGGGRTAVADFNRDGISDIFQDDFGIDSAPFPGGFNHLYLSNAQTRKLDDMSSTLTQTQLLNHSLSVGDVNGDGYLDVLVNSVSGPGNSLYMNDGTGHFVLRNELLPHLPGRYGAQSNTSSGMADVNHDGALDLIIGRWDAEGSAPASLVLLNDGKGDFTKTTPIVLPGSSVPLEVILDVKAIDLNGDAYPDLMVSISHGGGSADSHDDSYYNTGYIQLLVNQGGKSFVDETAARMPASILNNVGKGWFMALSAVDFDGDGHQDILATGAGGQASSVVLTNRGDGTFFNSWRSDPSGITVAADANGDGRTDLVTHLNGNIYVDLNTLDQPQTVVGSAGADTLEGTNANDLLYGAAGNDSIDGHAGTDTVRFTDKLANYTVRQVGGVTTVSAKTGSDGSDRLANVEGLQFADMSINLGVKALAATLPAATVQGIAELYVAFFNRMPDADGMAYWLGQAKAGKTLAQISESFYAVGASAQYAALTGFSTTMKDSDFINVFYKNVLGRAEGADANGLAYWSAKLSSGASTRASLAQDILASAHTFKGDASFGYVVDLLDNKIAVARTIAIDMGLSYNSDAYSHGIDIAKAVTPTSTAAALALVGIAPADVLL